MSALTLPTWPSSPTAELRTETNFWLHNRALSGQAGADVILSSLRERPLVRNLSITQNPLGSEGVRALLRGIDEQQLELDNLETLNLLGCEVGDEGLEAIVRWMGTTRAGRRLRELRLRDNGITGTSIPDLVALLRTHHLASLSLDRNPLIPSSTTHLLTHLHTPHLYDLSLSAACLTPSHAPLLSSLVRARARVPLSRLDVSQNALGAPGVEDLIWSVWESTRMWDCQLAGNVPGSPLTGPGSDARMTVMRAALTRNAERGDAVREAACRILVAARVVLHGAPAPECNRSDEHEHGHFGVLDLPRELQLAVLRAIDSLGWVTDAQFQRVVRYAEDVETLRNRAEEEAEGEHCCAFWTRTGCTAWERDGGTP